MKTKFTLSVILITLLVMAIQFFAISGLVWVVCWCFSWDFTWKIAIAVYAVWLLIPKSSK